jgi:hypothetical protein
MVRLSVDGAGLCRTAAARATFSKAWKIFPRFFQALENSRPGFPSLGKAGAVV